MGWSSTYGPDRATVAKLCFLSAKALSDAGVDNKDILAEGRALADSAFEEYGQVCVCPLAAPMCVTGPPRPLGL